MCTINNITIHPQNFRRKIDFFMHTMYNIIYLSNCWQESKMYRHTMYNYNFIYIYTTVKLEMKINFPTIKACFQKITNPFRSSSFLLAKGTVISVNIKTTLSKTKIALSPGNVKVESQNTKYNKNMHVTCHIWSTY